MDWIWVNCKLNGGELLISFVLHESFLGGGGVCM